MRVEVTLENREEPIVWEDVGDGFHPGPDDGPDLFVKANEVRVANGLLTRHRGDLGPGSLAVGEGGYKRISWDHFHDGAAKYTDLVDARTFRPDNRQAEFYALLTGGGTMSGNPARVPLGPDPDVGKPSTTGSARIAFPVADLHRHIVARGSSFDEDAAECRRWTREQFDRAEHYYDQSGRPWLAKKNGPRIGAYGGPGGFTNDYGRPDSHSGGKNGAAVDTYHLDLSQLIGTAVLLRSHMAADAAEDRIESAMSHIYNSPFDKPARHHGLILIGLAQAAIGIAPWRPGMLARLIGHIGFIVEKLGEANVNHFGRECPVVFWNDRCDHVCVTDELIAWVRKQVTDMPFLGVDPDTVDRKFCIDNDLISFQVPWMAALLGAGLSMCSRIPGLPDVLDDLIAEQMRVCGVFLARYSTTFAYKRRGLPLPLDAKKPLVGDAQNAVDTTYGPVFDSFVPSTGMAVGSYQHTVMGTTTDFLIPGMEELAVGLDGVGHDALSLELRQTVDDIVDHIIDRGFDLGNKPPEKLRNGSWWRIAGRRDITTKTVGSAPTHMPVTFGYSASTGVGGIT